METDVSSGDDEAISLTGRENSDDQDWGYNGELVI